MANLLMAVSYKDDDIKAEAVAGAMEYLKRKRKLYERLICEYLIAILNKDVETAGECLEKLCRNITKAVMIQEECVSDVTDVELSKAICLFGHGLCGVADYYLQEEVYGRMRLPDVNTFLTEYEIYRRRHKGNKHQVLVRFYGQYDFLNDVICLLPDISLKKGEPYTDADLDWNDESSRSSLEMDGKVPYPELADLDAPVKDYDTIFLGFPIWWGTSPKIVNQFVKTYDLTGKKVILFATSGSSGLGDTASDLAQDAIGTPEIINGRRFPASVSTDELKTWAESIK